MRQQSYGGHGRRAVDPTPAEIQERIREVHAMREQDERESPHRKRIEAVQLLLRQSGPITANSACKRLGIPLATCYQALCSLQTYGTVERFGGGAGKVFRLTGDGTVCDLPSADSILAKFRAKGAAKVVSHRVSPVCTRPLSAA